jgi:hypothetical protein
VHGPNCDHGEPSLFSPLHFPHPRSRRT